ncbi:hypothetical protein CYLTODRAFT_441431 [Cylindrobasidium torrendii FP15055 ss-10]|uniref:Uncharacterized protein n=1 Tax=Cylindrobasidium torrendii FP15055 ss-10 TaxID=1314674 RepID=A0A0D7BM34_9AGAR|nr:hypothetical protein CYLTODRAFT_441431 [Cylindrobasidium torrendii FP15055 ss-10]
MDVINKMFKRHDKKRARRSRSFPELRNKQGLSAPSPGGPAFLIDGPSASHKAAPTRQFEPNRYQSPKTAEPRRAVAHTPADHRYREHETNPVTAYHREAALNKLSGQAPPPKTKARSTQKHVPSPIKVPQDVPRDVYVREPVVFRPVEWNKSVPYNRINKYEGVSPKTLEW